MNGVRYQALLSLLRTAETIWEASRVFFTRWQLSPSQFNILNLLTDQPEGLSQIELGRQLLMHRSNVTGLVDRLERRGLLARRDAQADRRAYRVVLTASGRRLVQQILPEYHRLAEEVWGPLPATRARDLAEEFAKVGHNAQKLISRKEGA